MNPKNKHTMQLIPTSHAIDCANVPDGQLRVLLSEFFCNGAEYLVMNHSWCRRIVAEPRFLSWLHQLVTTAGLQFLDAHSPYGIDWDLNAPDTGRRRELFHIQHELMRQLSQLGVRNYVIHIGRAYAEETPEQTRELVAASLHELLPVAEQEGITICLENIRQPSNSPFEILRLINGFATPALGVCYDAGHAKIMECTDNVSTLAVLKPHITTCHLHDNDGSGDYHQMPGDGAIDWNNMMTDLSTCPRLNSIQSEVHFIELGQSVVRLCEVFRKLACQLNRRRVSK